METEVGPIGHIEVCCTTHTTPGVRRLVKSVVRGLKACQEPERAVEGMGGTYFFLNESGRKVAIVKPCDEEPLAPHNPKGYIGRNLGDPGWKSTVRVGEAAMREVAAYLLDHDHFAKVPHTVLVRAQHPIFNYNSNSSSTGNGSSTMSSSMASASAGGGLLAGALAAEDSSHSMGFDGSAAAAAAGGSAVGGMKLGSLQEFVYHIADTSEFGTQRLSTADVHHIGILDIRLFNTDRHAGNILVRLPGGGNNSSANLGCGMARLEEGYYELIPIDHGFCLPEALEAPYFEWLHWPQACLPFSQEELDYIENLDLEADVDLLRRELPTLRPECLRLMEVATTLLQKCAAAGLTLADIGGLMSRPLDALDGGDIDNPSELERACVVARQELERLELTQMGNGSSCSSASAFVLKEEDEEGFLEEEEDEGVDGGQQEAELQVAGAAAAAVEAGDVVGRNGSSSSGGSGNTQAMESPPAATAAAGGGSEKAEVRSPLTGARSLGMTSAEAEQLLFDWDDEGTDSSSVSAGRRQSCEMLQPLSPFSGMSLESSGSGNLADRAGNLPPSRLGLQEGQQLGQVALASSVSAFGALGWRPGGKKQSFALTRASRRNTLAYPPPVLSVPPRAISEVLSNMNSNQWEVFMRELGSYMDKALGFGQWKRQPPSSGGAAMSCPRF